MGTLEKTVFLISLALLALMYGYGARTFGWFPDRHLERAIEQAVLVVSDPLYVAPRVYHRSGVRTVESDAVQPGLTLLSTRWQEFEWDPGLKLVDREGRTLHSWRVDPAWFSDARGYQTAAGSTRRIEERPVHGVYLLPNGDVLLNLDYVGTARLDACGRIEWILTAGTHHSIERADDGSFWIPAASADVRDSTTAYPHGYPGLDQPIYLDQIFRVSAQGAILDSVAVLDLLYDNGLERHVFKSRYADSTDVTHLNDVEPLTAATADAFPSFESGDLAVSLRHLDLVFVVDPDTWRIKWHASHPFIEQHNPDFMNDGWIGVFDNNRDGTVRGTRLGGSRIVAIEPRADSLRILFSPSRSGRFHTDIMGKWQELANGNLLLTEARAGRVVEVTSDGRTVWEWINEPYSDALVPEVTEGTRHDLTPEQVAAWPCSPDERRSNPSQREAGKTRSGG